MQELLKSIFLFSNLSDRDLAKLETISRVKNLHTGAILFYEGDEPSKMYILLKGTIRAYKTDLKDNEIIIHHFEPVSLIGEMANFNKILFPATAEFESEGTVLEIDYALFEEEFLRNSHILFELMKSFAMKLKLFERVITSHLTLDSVCRVAKFLYEHEDVCRVVKRGKIASILNMTPETFSRMLKKLKTLGLISDDDDGLRVLNKIGLLELFSWSPKCT
jgi:CRP/FNR family transcriptional regulator, dissimilatory nitrate respiration regulator